MLRQVGLVANRKLSFFNVFRNRGPTCEKVDCTKPKEPIEKYIIEKSCCPSIFESWKPRIPELKSNPIKAQAMRQFDPPKVCVSGMPDSSISRCEAEAKARKCEKRNHPSWIKHCPKRAKKHVDGPLPPLRAAFEHCRKNKGKRPMTPRLQSMRKKCPVELPAADWNSDGFLG